MSRYFYRFWLPFSIAVHVLLVLVLIFVKPDEVHGTLPDEVTIVPITEVTVPDRPVAAIPPEKTTIVKAVTPGVPNPRKTGGAGQNPVVSHIDGPGTKGPTIAVSTMTVTKSTLSAPKGDPNGMGTAATGGYGEGGPSEGAGAEGNAHPTYPKIALEEGMEGTVIVSVSVSATGSIDSVSVSQHSRYDDLDRAAMRFARSWRFTPATKGSKTTTGSVRLRFTFADGKVTGSVERN
ncbi:MAG: energy transducer TonB [Armatimonadota bacterium]